MGINANNLIVQQARQDVKQAAQTLLDDIQSYRRREDIASLLATASQLASTVDNLIKNSFEVTRKIESAFSAGDPLGEIDVNAAQLLEVTRTWATFRDALDQRNGSQRFFMRLGLTLLQPLHRRREDSLVEAIAIGDQVVTEFYRVAQEKNLNLRAPEIKLITVLRDDRTHSEAFGEPTPFIVGPLWGYNQAWNYIAYAHEVGHHIYRNVDGLDCELMVNVILTLGLKGYKREDLRIWGAWLEEVFADLFCLLSVGPAAIHAGQRVALWITAESRRSSNSKDALTQILFSSRDWYHPVPYLRIVLGLNALKLLENLGPGGQAMQNQVKELHDRWANLTEQPEKIYVNDQEKDYVNVLNKGNLVVETILSTPLYALADKNGGAASAPRSILEVFYDDVRFQPRAAETLTNVMIGNIKQGAMMTSRPSKMETWQILAATEFARDTLSDEKSLQDLHIQAFKLLKQ